MEEVLRNLLAAVSAVIFFASLLFFDRLLRRESQCYEQQWNQDGRPIGMFTFTRQVSAKARPWHGATEFLRSFWLYVLWLFQAPSWVHKDPEARRLLWIARALCGLLIIGMYVTRETLY